MSSYNNYEDDDECDSSFMYRQRQAVKLDNNNIVNNENSKIEKHKKLEEDYDEDTQPLNLSLKPRSDEQTQFSSTIYSLKNKTNECNIILKTQNDQIIVKEEVVDKENIQDIYKLIKDEDSDNDLTDLNWLTSYNISKDFKIENFGCLSPESECDDEADGSHRPLSSFIPASLLHNMLVTHTKPPYSYSCLIFMSIESSAKKRLTVKEIYSWILNNFPYFRSIPSGSWKNSIRHNLSHNRCFKKVDKNLLTCRDFSGKGSLWCVNPDCRMVLIETLKKMPQKAYSILQDIPESLGIQTYKTTVLKSPKW
jgi:hypothetical protein